MSSSTETVSSFVLWPAGDFRRRRNGFQTQSLPVPVGWAFSLPGTPVPVKEAAPVEGLFHFVPVKTIRPTVEKRAVRLPRQEQELEPDSPRCLRLMAAVALSSNVLFGYRSRNDSVKGLIVLVLPFVLSLAFLLIADIDAPRHGLNHVSPQNLLARSLGH